MKSVRRLILTTAAIGGFLALNTAAGAVEPGYGPDSPAAESISQQRQERYGDRYESYGDQYGASGSATGGAAQKSSNCDEKGAATGSGTGGTTYQGSGSGTGGSVNPSSPDYRPGNGH